MYLVKAEDPLAAYYERIKYYVTCNVNRANLAASIAICNGYSFVSIEYVKP